jgi:hypothetical protein
MQISRLELSLLRLSDGIASAADLERLSKHFDEKQLNAWRQVSSVVSRTIQVPHIIPMDVSTLVMQQLQTQTDDEGRGLSAFDRDVLRRALTDTHEPDLAAQVLLRLKLDDTSADTDVQQRANLDSIEKTEFSDARASSAVHEPSESMPAEDWSYNQLLASVLTDDDVNEALLTDRIMDSVYLEARTPQDRQPEDFARDTALLKALESELNHGLDTEALDQPVVSTSSSMSFEHEIPSPVVAQKEPLSESYDHGMLIEFTEEEEFTQQIVDTGVRDIEEDSDDEVCSVEEGFVTEEMLVEQDKRLEQLQSVLLAGAATELDVWSQIVNEVTQPPLRLLRDDRVVEVVDKVPSFTGEEESFTPMDSAANVEFLSSKSIDADSTISKVSITVLGSFLAVAAAWVIIVLPSLLTQTTSTINTPKRIVTFEVAEVNQLEVEDLEVGEDMNVQILQGDANAPTIIFLDDMEPL